MPPLATNGQAIQSKTGTSKAKIIKMKPEIVMIPDMVLPTTSLTQGCCNDISTGTKFEAVSASLAQTGQ